MAKNRILLSDDHTLFRQGIKTLIAADDFHVSLSGDQRFDTLTKQGMVIGKKNSNLCHKLPLSPLNSPICAAPCKFSNSGDLAHTFAGPSRTRPSGSYANFWYLIGGTEEKV